MTGSCNICGGTLETVDAYQRLPRVSSDCKPVPPGGTVASCETCGSVQKPVTDAFLADIGRIYADYDVYYQGGGMEQVVFDSASGGPVRRSDLLADRLLASGRLAANGRTIDIGCGNGVFLRALSARLDGWRFEGLELDRRHETALATIPRFDQLVVGAPETLSGRYDLISMIHALEHFTDPYATLVALRNRLSDDGQLFIEIPNVAENPFDLLIADHVTHATPWSLEALLARAGYETVSLSTDWVKKELSVIARPARETVTPRQPAPERNLAARHIRWLEATLDRARAAATATPFGLFGTSIAATWLTGDLGQRIAFYVDEDPSRVGQTFLGKPVIAPSAIPRDATVFIGLAPVIAAVIAGKVTAAGGEAVVPPPLDGLPSAPQAATTAIPKFEDI